ncbi:hypothetical protein C0V72_14595 [Porphyrobacter sp. TH134]|uniref:hypothetical protein n=1 Tax=Porphyrobacter sp. TH134 TaxID=2067450 RepID=UPI000C7D695D|nr:hypothetical protein [Porphyrobacter sp. TH134]PLK22502.1 hypothetical protein C0V72_14595 [Porphyrobacter sp. TH134]
MQRAFANRDEQRTFRDELEQMLRRGEPEAALERARSRLREVAGASPRLSELALNTHPHQIALSGWDALAASILSAEEHGNKSVTAIGIDFSWPGHFASTIKNGKTVLDFDAQGGFTPVLETNYFGDLREVKFSTATRSDILAGYSASGSEWQGGFIDIDNLIGVTGMDALYGAVQSSSPAEADSAESDASVISACISAILLHLAVKRHIEAEGLPKPMAVLVGSNEDFPFFDAPVMSVDESRAYVRPASPARPQAPSQRAGWQRSEPPRGETQRERVRPERYEQPRQNAGSFGDSEDLAAIARVAESQLRHVRKPKDILPALGTVGLFALTQYLGKRK